MIVQGITMKKSSIILVIIIVIVIGAAFAVWLLSDRDSSQESSGSSTTNSNSSGTSGSSNSNADEPVSNPVVTYDGSSFSPDTLTISVGDTVTFRNDSSTEVWPASDDHPTHTNLSGFDPQRGLESGEDYSFTFEESGEWGYHNHLNPGQNGVIIVE